MPEYDFSGKVAFVTGAARGQGRSHALGYAEHGADVVAVDLPGEKSSVHYDLATRDDLDAVVDEVESMGQSALAVEADVSRDDEVRDAVEAAVDEFGRIDVLANNAGITTMAPLLEVEEPMWDELLDTNLKGAWLCSKHVGNHMVERGEGGKIVSTASAMAIVGSPMMGHYAASKHGLLGLTKTLALELAEHDVNVNAVAPTAVNSPLIQQSIEMFGREAVLEHPTEIAGPSNLFGNDGLVDPEDVTEAYLWLSSDAARFVTGSVLTVDGGMTVK